MQFYWKLNKTVTIVVFGLVSKMSTKKPENIGARPLEDPVKQDQEGEGDHHLKKNYRDARNNVGTDISATMWTGKTDQTTGRNRMRQRICEGCGPLAQK